jgi:formamidopyrimidine-DNA glycosylase
VPEILEVELYRALAEKGLGRTIDDIWMVDDRYGRGGTTTSSLQGALVGHVFTEARRRGKLLLLDADDGPTLGVRFGMTGGLVVDGAEALDRLLYGPGVFDEKWVRARVTFADGGHLLIHDPRRFGSLELVPNESRLGPDALTMTLDEFRSALASRLARPARSITSAPLKARLMDQERVAGIGNLLADEILWRASLDPARRSPLTDGELRALHKAMRATLRQLGRRGGSHMGDLMEQRHAGGRCPKDGAELRTATVGGRTTWWCPQHQY